MACRDDARFPHPKSFLSAHRNMPGCISSSLLAPSLSLFVSRPPSPLSSLSVRQYLSSCTLSIHLSRSVIDSLIRPRSQFVFPSFQPVFISVPSVTSLTLIQSKCSPQNGVDSMWRCLPALHNHPVLLSCRGLVPCVSHNVPFLSVHMMCSLLLSCLSMCQDYQVWQGGRQEWGLGCLGGGGSLNVHHLMHFNLFSSTVCTVVWATHSCYHCNYPKFTATLHSHVWHAFHATDVRNLTTPACWLLHAEGLGIEDAGT